MPWITTVTIRFLNMLQFSETTLQSVSSMSKCVMVLHLKPFLAQNNVAGKTPHQTGPLRFLPRSLNNTLTGTILKPHSFELKRATFPIEAI